MNSTEPTRAELGLLTPPEVAFMVARHQAQARGRFHATDRCWGISSDALADYALGLRGKPGEWEYPYDRADLAACERTYEMAPEHLRVLMLPILESYRAAVKARYSAEATR